jgi:hypothetical protein
VTWQGLALLAMVCALRPLLVALVLPRPAALPPREREVPRA